MCVSAERLIGMQVLSERHAFRFSLRMTSHFAIGRRNLQEIEKNVKLLNKVTLNSSIIYKSNAKLKINVVLMQNNY